MDTICCKTIQMDDFYIHAVPSTVSMCVQCNEHTIWNQFVAAEFKVKFVVCNKPKEIANTDIFEFLKFLHST
jgi:hypothetical protein